MTLGTVLQHIKCRLDDPGYRLTNPVAHMELVVIHMNLTIIAREIQTVWVCCDCDKWFLVARSQCDCGSKLDVGDFILHPEPSCPH